MNYLHGAPNSLVGATSGGAELPRYLATAAGLAPRLDQRALSIHYVDDFFGADRARRLIAEADISSADGPSPRTVTKADFWQLCLNNINQTNDEGHGLTRQPLPKSTWGTIFSSVNQMEMLGDGLYRLTELVPIVPAGIAASLGYGSNGIHLNIH